MSFNLDESAATEAIARSLASVMARSADVATPPEILRLHDATGESYWFSIETPMGTFRVDVQKVG